MIKVEFYDKVQCERLSFAIIISKMNGKWVLCKHKNRDTLEFPGGHREKGENILETAKRELQEETGAEEFTIKHISYYSEQNAERNEVKYGALFYAVIFRVNKYLHSEMERLELFNEMPDNLTYPEVTKKLIEKLKITEGEML